MALRQLRMENPGMRGNQYSDARGPIWHSLRALAGVTMVCALAVLLIGGLTLRGFGIGALDLTIAALYLGRRVGIVRAALWTFGLCIRPPGPKLRAAGGGLRSGGDRSGTGAALARWAALP